MFTTERKTINIYFCFCVAGGRVAVEMHMYNVNYVKYRLLNGLKYQKQ